MTNAGGAPERNGSAERDGEGRNDEQLELDAFIAREQALHEAMRPHNRDEAIALIRGGLVCVDAGCRFIREMGAKLEKGILKPSAIRDYCGTERFGYLERMTDYLWAAVVMNDREVFEEIRKTVRVLDKKRENTRPFGASTTDPYQAARWLRTDLERIKEGGFQQAVQAQYVAEGGKSLPTSSGPQLPATRWKVAGWMAIQLREFAPGRPQEELQREIYERMPMEHGRTLDRTGAFRDATFKEDATKAVIAAFKAIGLNTRQADQLFKADNMRRSRETKRRQQSARRKR